MRILIKNAFLVLEDRVEQGDLLIDGRTIAQVGGVIDGPCDKVIDAKGCYVFPGFIDTHTHFDLEVGSTVTADDFVTGTKAAVVGGTTTVLDFATQERGMTLMEATSTSDPPAMIWASGCTRRSSMASCTEKASYSSFISYMAYFSSLKES